MPIRADEHVDITPLNTLGITAKADYLVKITDEADIADAIAFAREQDLPWIPWGSGSNVVIGASDLHAVLLKIELKGKKLETHDGYANVTVAAGENWDAFVAWAVQQGLVGVESLALIPGTVGAAPVQNVGAYGQEVSEVITAVHAYDAVKNDFVTLGNADCQFSYRDSVFKRSRRYIITAVTFQLEQSTKVPSPTYASLQDELKRLGIEDPTAAEVRKAVISIRHRKLPDPEKIPTVGSFFHNPIISTGAFQKIQQKHHDVPHWPTNDGQIKLSGAWLIEQCGFRGKVKDGVGTYDKQALCLVNPGHRPARDVLAFRDTIIKAVREEFDVTLNMEPELISANPAS